jgi:RNA polymerase sigma factor (sigma-70 family)
MQNFPEKIKRSKSVDFEEKKLLHLFLSGDEKAYTKIYNHYVDMLFAYGVGLGFEREMIKDAIQDVFYKLYFNRKSLRQIDNLKYYLFRMLKNRLLDITKTMMGTNDIDNYEQSFSIKVTILDELILHEDKLILQNKIEKLLACLTNRQREAIYLRFMQEMEYEEIADLLKMTPSATRKLIFRAMERMREQDLSVLILFLSIAFHKNCIFYS